MSVLDLTIGREGAWVSVSRCRQTRSTSSTQIRHRPVWQPGRRPTSYRCDISPSFVRPRKSLKFLIFVELFNGYSWQSRILEVRADRLPPDFDAPLGPNGYPVAVPSPLHAMPYMALPQQQLQQGTLPLAGGEDVQQIPSPMGMYFAGLQQDRNRLPSANGRTLFVGNVRVLSLTFGNPRVQGARVVR